KSRKDAGPASLLLCGTGRDAGSDSLHHANCETGVGRHAGTKRGSRVNSLTAAAKECTDIISTDRDDDMAPLAARCADARPRHLDPLSSIFDAHCFEENILFGLSIDRI